MLDVDREAITDGPVGRVLLLLAAPLVAQNLVYVANALVDTFWLGRVSEDAVAAVGLSLPIQSLLGAAVVIAAVGTQILVAQRAGGEDGSGARRVAVNGALVALAVTGAIAVPVVAYPEELVRLLGADPALAGTTATYLAIIVAVLPVGAVGDTVENCFTAYGDTRAVLHVSVVSVLVNLVAAPALIFGVGPVPELGVAGAALGTVLSGIVGFVHILAYAAGIGRDTFRLTRDAFAVDLSVVREVVAVGLPLGGQRGVSELVRVLVVSLVAIAGGAAGVAAYTVGARVATLAVVPALGDAAGGPVDDRPEPRRGRPAPRPADDDGRHQTGRRRLPRARRRPVPVRRRDRRPPRARPHRDRPVAIGVVSTDSGGHLRGRSAGPTPCSPASTALRAPEPRSSRI